jgi:hypothetical protein
VTAPDPGPPCSLCPLPATVAVEPPRRTLARGPDPSDDSYSVTVILPDAPLCAEHERQVRQGDMLLGWCDDERCRTYGQAGGVSTCGGEYKGLVPAKPRCHPSK